MSADSATTEVGNEPRSISEMSFPRRVIFWGFATLLLLGIIFYLWWGFSFGVWIDNGVYAVVVTLVLLGLAGMWLMMPNPPPDQTLPSH